MKENMNLGISQSRVSTPSQEVKQIGHLLLQFITKRTLVTPKHRSSSQFRQHFAKSQFDHHPPIINHIQQKLITTHHQKSNPNPENNPKTQTFPIPERKPPHPKLATSQILTSSYCKKKKKKSFPRKNCTEGTSEAETKISQRIKQKTRL